MLFRRCRMRCCKYQSAVAPRPDGKILACGVCFSAEPQKMVNPGRYWVLPVPNVMIGYSAGCAWSVPFPKFAKKCLVESVVGKGSRLSFVVISSAAQTRAKPVPHAFGLNATRQLEHFSQYPVQLLICVLCAICSKTLQQLAARRFVKCSRQSPRGHSWLAGGTLAPRSTAVSCWVLCPVGCCVLLGAVWVGAVGWVLLGGCPPSPPVNCCVLLCFRGELLCPVVFPQFIKHLVINYARQFFFWFQVWSLSELGINGVYLLG